MHEPLEVAPAEREVELEAQSRRLDADVRVEVAAPDLCKHVFVGACNDVRLLLVRDLLAEDVDSRELPLRVQRANGRRGIAELGAGDVTGGDGADDRTRHRG